jgi:hypothetical protein
MDYRRHRARTPPPTGCSRLSCLALFAGLRRDEIDTLACKQIDFTLHTVRIDRVGVRNAEQEAMAVLSAFLIFAFRSSVLCWHIDSFARMYLVPPFHAL